MTRTQVGPVVARLPLAPPLAPAFPLTVAPAHRQAGTTVQVDLAFEVPVELDDDVEVEIPALWDFRECSLISVDGLAVARAPLQPSGEAKEKPCT